MQVIAKKQIETTRYSISLLRVLINLKINYPLTIMFFLGKFRMFEVRKQTLGFYPNVYKLPETSSMLFLAFFELDHCFLKV